MPCKVLYCIASTKFMHNMQKKPAECAEQCKKKKKNTKVKGLNNYTRNIASAFSTS